MQLHYMTYMKKEKIEITNQPKIEHLSPTLQVSFCTVQFVLLVMKIRRWKKLQQGSQGSGCCLNGTNSQRGPFQNQLLWLFLLCWFLATDKVRDSTISDIGARNSHSGCSISNKHRKNRDVTRNISRDLVAYKRKNDFQTGFQSISV